MYLFQGGMMRKWLARLVLFVFSSQIFFSTISVTYADDTTPPVVALIGANPLDTAYQGSFVDPGAEWTDDTDGTGSILASSGTVDTNTLGTYLLEYTHPDIAGNLSNTEIRTVNVLDMTAPVLTLSGSNPYDVIQGDTFTDPGVSCVDNVDTTCTPIFTGSIDTATIGTYIVGYDVVDAAGNTGSISRSVNVIANSSSGDTTPPVISLSGSTSITVEASSGSYIDQGAEWTDNVDGSGSTLDTTFTFSGNVDLSSTGVYIVTYTKTDSSNNTTEIQRTITVVDTTAPLISLIGASSISIAQGTSYVDMGATWRDLALSAVLIASGSVDTTRVGTYTLTYTIRDASGNMSTLTRTVSVYSTAVNTPVIMIGAGGGGGGSASNTSSSNFSIPLAGFLFARYLLPATPDIPTVTPVITIAPDTINVTLKIPFTKKVFRKVLTFPKGSYTLSSNISIVSRKLRSSQYDIVSGRAGDTLRVRYIDESGWALVTTASGIWGFIESTYLIKKI